MAVTAMLLHNGDEKLPAGLFDAAPLPHTTGPRITPPSDAVGERKIRQAIGEASQQNSALLREIADTADAVSQLPNSEVNLSSVKEELAKQDQEVERAALSTSLYQLRYARRRDNSLTKWLYILTRMRQEFEAKVKEAERLYHEAVAVQTRFEQRRRALQSDLRAIEEDHAIVEAGARRHETAHKELDALYASIFTGPTPGFPDEDELENVFDAKKTEHLESSRTLRGTTRARKQASAVGTAIEKASAELSMAAEEADDAFFISDYAVVLLIRAGRFLDQALRFSNDILGTLPKPISRELVKLHETMSKHLNVARQATTEASKGNYSSRSGLIESTEAVRDQLNGAEEAQSQFLRYVKVYEGDATVAVTNASRRYEDARQALHGLRQSIFEQIAGFGAAAPAYHECCDRAAGYAQDVFAECLRVEVPSVTEEGLPPPPSYERRVDAERSQ